MAGLLLAAIFKPKPLFQTGLALAISMVTLAYLSINWIDETPEGLLGLGHLFSLPGGVLGILISGRFIKVFKVKAVFVSLILGFMGFFIGFLINQIIVCNTLMWCGPLTFVDYNTGLDIMTPG